MTKSVICAPSFDTKKIRYVTPKTKDAVKTAYGLPVKNYGKSLEIDHIVPLELGGSNDIANLFPEKAEPQPGYRLKDVLENKLHKIVCAGQERLQTAQRQIASDWEALYTTVYRIGGARSKEVQMKTDVVSNLVVLLICLGYGVAVWLLQMHRVAPPRDWLLQRVKDVKARIETEGWNAGEPGKNNLTWLQERIDQPWPILPTSRVQAGWRQVHGLEDQHILELTDPQLITEQLQTTQTQLAKIAGPEAAGLVKRIKAVGAEVNPSRAVLHETKVFLHNVNDTAYEDLAGLLAKAVWLVALALALIVGLAVLFDRESFFLLGAAGALISRLTRVLKRRPSASDYGASWSTLIVGPAAGALAGWIGVLIVSEFAKDPFNVLDNRFATVWDDALAPLGLFLAFAFGFSERLFNRLLGVAESEVGAALPPPEKTANGSATAGGSTAGG